MAEHACLCLTWSEIVKTGFFELPVYNHMDHFSQELGLEDKDEMPINHLSDFQYEQNCEENLSLDIILSNQVSHKPGCAATSRQQTICSI